MCFRVMSLVLSPTVLPQNYWSCNFNAVLSHFALIVPPPPLLRGNPDKSNKKTLLPDQFLPYRTVSTFIFQKHLFLTVFDYHMDEIIPMTQLIQHTWPFLRYRKLVIFRILGMTCLGDQTWQYRLILEGFLFSRMQKFNFIAFVFLEILQRYWKFVILGTLSMPAYGH